MDDHAFFLSLAESPIEAAFAHALVRVGARRCGAVIAFFSGSLVPLLAVELDGRDFHAAHAWQVARDKRRDRRLLAVGFRVARFTGSEVTADADRCAREAVAIVAPISKQETLEAHGR